MNKQDIETKLAILAELRNTYQKQMDELTMKLVLLNWRSNHG